MTRAAWHTDTSSSVAYPPQPWHLGGQLDLTLWRVPASQLPPAFTTAVPDGYHPVQVGGRCLVGTAMVRYDPGGVLSYHELLAALLVRSGRRVAVTIPAIWVDSVASQIGGRRLWGIPKELATFDRRETTAGLRADVGIDGSWLASATFRSGRALPGRWGIRQSYVHRLEGRTVQARSSGSSRIAFATGHWDFAADGPLAFLRGRRPTRSLEQRDLALRFGTRAIR